MTNSLNQRGGAEQQQNDGDGPLRDHATAAMSLFGAVSFARALLNKLVFSLLHDKTIV